jgi:hypothetical protein
MRQVLRSSVIFGLHILALLLASAGDPYAASREGMVRELDERRGLGELTAQHLTGRRRRLNTQLPLAHLSAQPV